MPKVNRTVLLHHQRIETLVWANKKRKKQDHIYCGRLALYSVELLLERTNFTSKIIKLPTKNEKSRHFCIKDGVTHDNFKSDFVSLYTVALRLRDSRMLFYGPKNST
jgi:hypothetical protein